MRIVDTRKTMAGITIGDAKRELNALELIVATTRLATERNGEALAEIKEKGLWRATGEYKSWDDYTQKRWGVRKNQADHRIRAAKIAGEISPDKRLIESHISSLAGFQPDMRREIYETAEATAPGGKLTAAWIERVGRNMIDARLAGAHAAEEEERRNPQIANENDSESDADTTNDPSPTESDTCIHDAIQHPLTKKEQRKQYEEQAKRWVHKGERLALALNCTPEDLIEKYG